jgi:hypothetical protein
MIWAAKTWDDLSINNRHNNAPLSPDFNNATEGVWFRCPGKKRVMVPSCCHPGRFWARKQGLAPFGAGFAA